MCFILKLFVELMIARKNGKIIRTNNLEKAIKY